MFSCVAVIPAAQSEAPSATAWSDSGVRPARCTVAPSRAKARATADPIEPAPPVDDGVAVFEQH
jgi:hypothetical protein